MKTILLWDPRFPDRRPARLTVEDTVASAAVRTGVAAAANPAEAGALSTGGALDPGTLTEVALQHGSANAIRRVFIPYSVALVGAAAGVLAAIGVPLAGGTTPPPLPTLTLTDPLTYATNAAAGTPLATGGGFQSGEAFASVSPSDKLAVNGTQLLVGVGTQTVGSFAFTITTTAGRTISSTVTVSAAPATPPAFIFNRPTNSMYAGALI